jgi:hypothetical protein
LLLLDSETSKICLDAMLCLSARLEFSDNRRARRTEANILPSVIYRLNHEESPTPSKDTTKDKFPFMNEEKSSDELTQIVMLQRQVANLRAIANELFYFNRATLGVGNTKTMSSRATADRISGGLRTGTKSNLGRIAELTVLGSMVAAGLFVALAPMPARADDVGKEIAALQTEVADLQSLVGNLQTSNSTLAKQVNTLQSQLAAVESNPALALGPFVSVDPNPEIGVMGPHIIFKGANIHVISGSGATNDNDNPTGLGNLIIGYDESFSPAQGGSPPTMVIDRGGSHNLVIGRFNNFTKAAFGGLVAGEENTISNEAASVSGGVDNTASGHRASVSGGFGNTASGQFASISGGNSNIASGTGSSASGGVENTASGSDSIVIGGHLNTATKIESIVPQPPFP